MTPVQRLPIQTILDSPTIMISASQEAYEAGALFEFGIEKTRLGFRLTVNYRFPGIYLHKDVEEFRHLHTEEYHDAVIAPEQARAGEIEGEAWMNINIYVLPGLYDQFCQDAEYVFGLYGLEDLCFRGIPDIWFGDLALCKFIREYLRPHPKMVFWFEGTIASSLFREALPE